MWARKHVRLVNGMIIMIVADIAIHLGVLIDEFIFK